MGKFKKGNVQQGAKVAKPKMKKESKTGQKKGGVQNGVSKINPKKHSVKLTGNIKEQVKNQKNKKDFMGKGSLNQIVTVNTPINKNKKGKLPGVGLQIGQGKGEKKELKNVTPQIKAKNNIPLNKPQNKKNEKSGTEKNLKQQVEPVPKLPLPSTRKNNEKKQMHLPQKGQVMGPKSATKEKPENALKVKKQKRPVERSEAKIKKSQKAVSVSLQQKLIKEADKEENLEDKSEDLEQFFDEAKFNEIVKQETIAKIVEALKTNVANEVKQKKNQIFADYKYMLNVTCFKIPYCPKRMVKLKLKHSLISEDDEVCLIVKDLKRGMRADYEPTIHHYEDLLRENGVKGIKTIMPFNQLRKEYGSYEMKRKLSNTYDYFLCDGTISGHVAGFLGLKFRKSRCSPQAVRFNTKNLAREIEKACQKTSYRQGEKGSCISIPVAHHKMSAENVAENILCVISQLKKVYPGGLANIRNLYVRVNMKSTTALPLYVSLAPPQKIPFVIGPREENLKKLKAKANKILEKFDLTAAGEIVQKRELEKDDEDVEEEPKMKKKKNEKTTKLAGNAEKKANEKKQTRKDISEASKKKENALNSKSAVEIVEKKTEEIAVNAENKKDKAKQTKEVLKEKPVKGNKTNSQTSEENVKKLLKIAASRPLPFDGHRSDEDGTSEEGDGTDEEEDGTDEEEDGSDDIGSDEEGSEEEGSALEFDSEDDDSDDYGSAEDIEGAHEDDSTEESIGDDDEDDA